ncbi:MAG: hypothetical protein PHE61_05925 [Candidatus Omnitrophica bacterium]|nr:hypothetical protein [Candidatus Omnitrophota bacterium]
MSWILFAIGAMWLAEGLLGLFAPEKVRGILSEYFNTYSVRSISIILFILGGFLIVSAHASRIPLIIVIFGSIVMMKGVGVLFLPFRWVDGLLKWWLKAPDLWYRAWAVFVLFLGCFLLIVRK